jgi:PIN domain nuclease of toxin-antitoxin system
MCLFAQEEGRTEKDGIIPSFLILVVNLFETWSTLNWKETTCCDEKEKAVSMKSFSTAAIVDTMIGCGIIVTINF